MQGGKPSAASALPAERGGPRASNRLDFQKNWTLCRLLELHEAGGDYVLVCDYHDDVLVLEPRDDGDDLMHFFQVKSASKSWTLAALLKAGIVKKKKVNSILGKLYRHASVFGSGAASVNLVSNERFKLELLDGSSGSDRDNFRLEEVCEAERNEVQERVATEHSEPPPAVFPPRTHFIWTTLQPEGQDTYVRGRLAEFFDEVLHKKGVDVIAAHRTLFDEIRKQSNNESLWPNLPDLIKMKGIRRERLDRMLRSLAVTRDYANDWRGYSTELAILQVPLAERLRIEDCWTKYRFQRMDETAEAVQNFRERICLATADALRSIGNGTLMNLLDAVVASVGTDAVFSADYVRAASLYEITDNEHPAIQEARSQSTTTKP